MTALTTDQNGTVDTTTVVRQRAGLVLVDPSELSEDAQADLAHFIRYPKVPAGPGFIEAWCGESVMADDPEAFKVSDSAPTVTDAPDDLVLMCARCQRISDMVRSALRGRHE